MVRRCRAAVDAWDRALRPCLVAALL